MNLDGFVNYPATSDGDGSRLENFVDAVDLPANSSDDDANLSDDVANWSDDDANPLDDDANPISTETESFDDSCEVRLFFPPVLQLLPPPTGSPP